MHACTLLSAYFTIYYISASLATQVNEASYFIVRGNQNLQDSVDSAECWVRSSATSCAKYHRQWHRVAILLLYCEA